MKLRIGLFAACAAITLAGCETAPRNTAGAVATGAVIGGLVGAAADKPLEGAVVGGLAGAAVAVMTGRTSDGRCTYRDRTTGRTWVGAC